MAFQGDSIFWVDTEKVVPNPFQPRREFDQSKLQELSESIRMYGVLQPLTVTRSEVQRDDGTFYTEYELIAGERRLRASRLANVAQVPVIIREGEQNEQEKLELAIIENLQREDLNAIDRALAFQQLAEQFELSHTQVAQKVQRSREYVSNSIRLLALPEHIRTALQRGELGEGHARTLLMLNDKPEEQETIFREILLKKMSVREVERIVRKIASDKVRKRQETDIGDHLIEIEKEFTETLGTRVQIQKTDFGGKLTIDYFSEDDLSSILKRMQAESGGDAAKSTAASVAAMVAATPLDSAEPTAPTPPEQPVSAPIESHSPLSTPPTPPAPQPKEVAPPSELKSDLSEPPSGQYQQPAPVAPEYEAPASPSQTEPVTAEPVAAMPSDVPVEQPKAPAQASTADRDTLERLTAHTPVGFSRPEPVTQPTADQAVDEQPQATAPQPEQPHAPVESVSQEIEETAATPDVNQQPPAETSSAAAPTEPAATEPVANQDDAEDIYSVRNFSI